MNAEVLPKVYMELDDCDNHKIHFYNNKHPNKDAQCVHLTRLPVMQLMPK